MKRDDCIRLFPLGGVVLFPHAMIPLHIFEPRYRQMTEDALADDRRIALVLPKPVSPIERQLMKAGMRTPIHSIGCVGSIHHENRLPDGRYTFILEGEKRFRVIEELDSDRMYRIARVEFLEDRLHPDLVSRRRLQRIELLEMVARLLPVADANARQFIEFLKNRAADAEFVDMLAYAAPLPCEEKQSLLAIEGVDERMERLISCLKGCLAQAGDSGPSGFPPQFSRN